MQVVTLKQVNKTNAVFWGLGYIVSKVLCWAPVQGVERKGAWLLKRRGGKTTDLDLSLRAEESLTCSTADGRPAGSASLIVDLLKTEEKGKKFLVGANMNLF